MDESARSRLGVAARAQLAYAWDRWPRRSQTIRLALQSVSLTYDTDPSLSRELLGRVLDADRVAQWGYEELPILTRMLPVLIEQDPELVATIYKATFAHEEVSRDSTSMRGGVLPLSSNRRQDYQMAQHDLARRYGSFLHAAPEQAVPALGDCITPLARRRGGDLSERRITWRGREAKILADASGIWDDTGLERDESTMLAAWQRRIIALARKRDRDELEGLLDGLGGTAWPAAMWAHVLRAAAAVPRRLGSHVVELLEQPEILSDSDLVYPAGQALASISAVAGVATRRRLERAVLDLPRRWSAPSDVAGHRRDELLGCFAGERLVSSGARTRYAALETAGGAPELGPRFAVYSSWEPYDDDAVLREQGHDPQAEHNQAAKDLVAPVREWVEARRDVNRDESPIDALLPALRVLLTGLLEVRRSGAADHLVDSAEGYLGEATTRLAETLTPDSPADQIEFVREVARCLQKSPRPTSVEEDERWDSSMPAHGWPAQRDQALALWLTLGRYPRLLDDEIVSAVRRAATDPAAVVRQTLAKYAWWLRSSRPDVVWELAERLAAHEQRWAVLGGLLSTLSALVHHDLERAAALISSLHNRALGDSGPVWFLQQSSWLVLQLWIEFDHPAGCEELTRLENDLVNSATQADRVFFRLRERVTEGEPGDAQAEGRRLRALELWTRLVARGADIVDERLRALPEDPDERARSLETLKPVAEMLITGATEVQFAAGASRLSRKPGEWHPTPAQRERLYREGTELLDAVSRVGIAQAADDVVQTLGTYVHTDPRGVLRRLAVLLPAAEAWGYQADSLAERSFIDVASRLLAGHRDVLLTDAESRERLLLALDSFVRAGSASARRMLLGLDDIFR